jgi:hypothetical protein
VRSWSRAAAIAAVLLLVLNDHVLKRAYPGFVTGKLSDVAGMIFFPVLLTTLVWTLVPSRHRSDPVFDRVLVTACLATALVFALTKTTLVGNDAYRFVWGAMQWPYRALRALAHGRAMPGIARVVLVRDPSDLLAVPFVGVAYLAAARRARQPLFFAKSFMKDASVSTQPSSTAL